MGVTVRVRRADKAAREELFQESGSEEEDGVISRR